MEYKFRKMENKVKILISSYLALVTSIFGQNTGAKKQDEPKVEEMFYVTMGSSIPIVHNKYYTRGERTAIITGIGVRSFFGNHMGLDVATTFYHHPLAHAIEGSIIWLYKPEVLEGIYGGFGGTMQKEMDVHFNRQLSFAYKVLIGYQFPSETAKTSFIDVGFDRFQVMTIRSGLLF
jgi:hypothetical protein